MPLLVVAAITILIVAAVILLIRCIYALCIAEVAYPPQPIDYVLSFGSVILSLFLTFASFICWDWC